MKCHCVKHCSALETQRLEDGSHPQAAHSREHKGPANTWQPEHFLVEAQMTARENRKKTTPLKEYCWTAKGRLSQTSRNRAVQAEKRHIWGTEVRGNPACCRHRSPGAAETGRWEDKEKGQVTSQPLSHSCAAETRDTHDSLHWQLWPSQTAQSRRWMSTYKVQLNLSERKSAHQAPQAVLTQGPLGAWRRRWADLPQLPCNPEGRPAEQGEGGYPSARHEATHCLLSLLGGCWVWSADLLHVLSLSITSLPHWEAKYSTGVSGHKKRLQSTGPDDKETLDPAKEFMLACYR